MTLFAAVGMAGALLIQPERASPIPFGTYDAWIEMRAGRATFTLDIRAAERDGREAVGEKDLPAFAVSIINGEELIPIPNAVALRMRDHSVALRLCFDPYEAEMVVTPGEEPGTLSGAWIREKDRYESEWLPMGAMLAMPLPLTRPEVRTLPERWSIEFEPAPPKKPVAGEDGSAALPASPIPEPPAITSPDIGLFRVMPDGRARGTILTTTGDSRYLHGTFDGETLELCSFSGSGVSMIRATYTAASGGGPATLAGERWSGVGSHRRFTAVADSSAALPDDMSITRAIARPELEALRFLDERGREVAMSSLVDGPAIIQIFGTWCGNSNDAAALMKELDASAGACGVDVVALAFEATGEFAVDSARIALFRARHGVTYPILLAGTSDKKRAAARLPFLDRVHSFPSLIFLDAEGNVRAIHTGYSGPATLEAHDEMRARIMAAAASIGVR